MKRTLAILTAAALMGAATLTTPTPAEARGGRVAAGIFAGLAAGAILGGALYGPRYYGYYGPGPVYYDYPPPPYYYPDCYWTRHKVWNGHRWRLRRVRVCD